MVESMNKKRSTQCTPSQKGYDSLLASVPDNLQGDMRSASVKLPKNCFIPKKKIACIHGATSYDKLVDENGKRLFPDIPSVKDDVKLVSDFFKQIGFDVRNYVDMSNTDLNRKLVALDSEICNLDDENALVFSYFSGYCMKDTEMLMVINDSESKSKNYKPYLYPIENRMRTISGNPNTFVVSIFDCLTKQFKQSDKRGGFADDCGANENNYIIIKSMELAGAEKGEKICIADQIITKMYEKSVTGGYALFPQCIFQQNLALSIDNNSTQKEAKIDMGQMSTTMAKKISTMYEEEDQFGALEQRAEFDEQDQFDDLDIEIQPKKTIFKKTTHFGFKIGLVSNDYLLASKKSSSGSYKVKLFDVRNWEPVSDFKCSGNLKSQLMTKKYLYVATQGEPSMVTRFDLKNFKHVEKFELPESAVPNNLFCFKQGGDRKILVGGKKLGMMIIDEKSKKVEVPANSVKGFTKDVQQAKSDPTNFISSHKERNIDMIQVNQDKAKVVYSGESDYLENFAIKYIKDNDVLCSGDDNFLYIWSMKDNKCTKVKISYAAKLPQGSQISMVRLHPDWNNSKHNYVIIITDDNQVYASKAVIKTTSQETNRPEFASIKTRQYCELVSDENHGVTYAYTSDSKTFFAGYIPKDRFA